MRIILVLIIKLYWKLVPEHQRGACIFRKSCSNYIFEIASENGFIKGIEAFNYRFKNCRSGFSTFENPITGKIQMLLATDDIIGEEEIAQHYVTEHRKK